jgi:signal peptidase I
MSAEMPDAKAQGSVWADAKDIAKIVVEALALALIVRVFLFQPFNIPSGSMENTLLTGDYIFVSKYSYGYSKYSFLWDWPPYSGRIWQGRGPMRGDVAVFRKPSQTETDYIKRVVGLPGDTLQMLDGELYVNDQKLPKIPAEPYVKGTEVVPRFEETNLDGIKYFVLDAEPNGSFDSTRAYTVPPSHYFMMGDNRDNSSDSRDPGGGVGFVPIDNFVGRAQVIFFSHDEQFSVLAPWGWPWHVRWSRFGKLVY